MNEKFQYRTRPPSAVLKISSLLSVNEYRKIPIIHVNQEKINKGTLFSLVLTFLLFKLNTLQKEIVKL